MSGSPSERLRWLLLALSLAPCLAVAAVQGTPPLPTGLQKTFEATRSDVASTVDAAWIDAMQRRLASHLPDADRRRTLLRRVRAEARLAGLDPQIVLAVIQVESGFRTQAESPAGARGLMQVMPFWKRVLGRADDDLHDPATNLRYGCTILAYYLRQEHGDLTRALARYHGSRGRTDYPERVMRAWQRHWWLADPRH